MSFPINVPPKILLTLGIYNSGLVIRDRMQITPAIACLKCIQWLLAYIIHSDGGSQYIYD